MTVHGATLAADAIKPGMRVFLSGDWRTVSSVVRGASHVTLWVDGKPWPAVRSGCMLRVAWVQR